MTTEIDMEVVSVLDHVHLEQQESFNNTGRCFKEVFMPTDITSLEYHVINYWNPVQGAGYGVVFLYTDSNGMQFEMSTDLGFIDPDVVFEDTHPITEFEWRMKNVS